MKLSVLWNFTILMAACSYGVLAPLVGFIPFVGFIFSILVMLSLVRYSYQVLICCAQGHEDVAPPDFDTVNPFNRFSLMLHFIGFFAAVIAVGIYLPVPAVFVVLIAAVFPASAALMAVTGNLEAAFSPSAVLQTIVLLGRDYAVVCIAAVLVAAGAGLIANLASGNAAVSLFVSAMAEAWAMMGTFGLIGAALHAHRLDFDIPGERADPEERAHAEQERAWRDMLDRAYASLRSGRPDAGYQELRQFLEAHAGSPQAHYWLVENLLDWEDKRHAVAVAARLIEAEIEANRPGNALTLYRRCQRIGSEVELQQAAADALAAYARSIGQHGVASELAAGAGTLPAASHARTVGYNPGSGKPT